MHSTFRIAHSRSICLTACVLAPAIILMGWGIKTGSATSAAMELRHSEAFSSYRSANSEARR